MMKIDDGGIITTISYLISSSLLLLFQIIELCRLSDSWLDRDYINLRSTQALEQGRDRQTEWFARSVRRA